MGKGNSDISPRKFCVTGSTSAIAPWGVRLVALDEVHDLAEEQHLLLTPAKVVGVFSVLVKEFPSCPLYN